MKANVLQRSSIVRYDGSFASVSAFRLSPARVTDNETAEVRGTGEVVFSGDGDVALSYREEEGVSVSVKREGERLTVTRGGAVLCFVTGSVTAFSYRMAYGELPTEAFTEQITLQKKGGTALLTLVYVAVLGGMAQKNTVRFKITC